LKKAMKRERLVMGGGEGGGLFLGKPGDYMASEGDGSRERPY